MDEDKLDKWMTFGDNRIAFHKRTGQMYVNGEPVITERRFATQERVIAWLGLFLALVGVAATAVQAWFTAFPPH